MLTPPLFFYKIQYSQLRFGMSDRGIPQQGPSPVAVERTEGYYPVTRGLILETQRPFHHQAVH